MTLDIKPIISTLSRHRIAASLIVLEIALACSVLCNALFLAASRMELIGMNSGVDEASIATLSLLDCESCSEVDVNSRWLQQLRGQAGVQASPVLHCAANKTWQTSATSKVYPQEDSTGHGRQSDDLADPGILRPAQ